MKKKGIATLALAGALAATMVPAFAASNQTTVGYTANGNASIDGDVMVTVPKNVTFTDDQKSVTGFDVKAYTWKDGTWTAVGAGNALPREIKVKAESTNGFKLITTNPTYESTKIDYTYTTTALVTGTAENNVGTLSGENGTIQGTVAMTQAPTLPNDAGHVYFSDTLTYTFTGLDKTQG